MLTLLASLCAILVVTLSTLTYFKRRHSFIQYGILSIIFEIYVFYHWIIGMKKQDRKNKISLKLQLIDEYLRKYSKPDFSNHSIDSALKLLTDTRSARDGFLKYTLAPSNECIEIEQINDIECWWINKKHRTKTGVIISFHGGAYVSGQAMSCFPYLIPLCDMTGMAGCSVHYSLSPEHILPTPINEGLAVYKYLTQKLKINPQMITLMGDSAGGSLVILLLQKIIQLDLPVPCCGITSSSWDVPTDGISYIENKDKDSLLDQATGKIWGNFAVGNIDIDIETKKCFWAKTRTSLNSEYCSYLHKNATFKGFPPLFLSASENECVLSDSLSVIERCKKDNVKDVVLEISPLNGVHVLEDFVGFGVPESLELLQKEAKFILEHRKM